jgi:glycosyltransferase involved in cell wall biosynthesis
VSAKKRKKFSAMLTVTLILAITILGLTKMPGLWTELTFYWQDHTETELKVKAYAEEMGIFYAEYPQSLIDNSKRMYQLKKKWFTGVKNLTIVPPSQWLADLVKESFLQAYPVKVIHNGIDLSVFQPTESDFREKYHIPEDKSITLGNFQSVIFLTKNYINISHINARIYLTFG